MNRSSNQRRQTLGPVNVNVGADKGNRRQSVDPSTSGGHSKARPPTGRASMIPRVGRENLIPPTPPSTKPRQTSSSRRRSSLGPDRRQSLPPPPAPAKTDPRQVSDKAFQQSCIKKLLKYLVDHGYDHPITHKSLARPSGKDFNHIVTFLFRQIDPSFQDGTMKIEDEVAMSFKAIGYPFPVSKTSLVAAGSPHAWPSLLAALTWLTERIQCFASTTFDSNDSETFGSLEELEIKTDKAFFKYLGASYTAFLQGDEQATEDLEVSLAEQFERDDEIIEKEIEQMTDKNAVIVEQINNLTMGGHDLEEYVKKRDGYQTDLAQFHDLINQMDNHVNMLHQKKIDRAKELHESTGKLAETNTTLDELKDAVRSQELSLEGARNIQNTIKGLSEAIDRARSLNENRRGIASQRGVEQQALWNNVEDIVSVYNSGIREIVPMLPPSDTLLAKLDIADKKVTSGGLLLGKDLENEVQNRMSSLKDLLTSSLATSRYDYQERLDELGQCEGVLAESQENVKIIESKVLAREDTMNNERQLNQATCGVRLREAESLETKVSSLRDPVALEERMTQYERQCAELESLRLKNLESGNSLIRAVFAEIENASGAMDQFDAFFSSKATEAKEYRSELRSFYEQLEAPLDSL